MTEAMKEILKLIRVKQWVKNGFLFAALIFAQHLFDAAFALKALLAFIVFSFTASGVYVVNDIFDAARDRLHPEKKLRPVASRKISAGIAWLVAVVMFIASSVMLWLLPLKFALVIGLYVVMNVLYSWRLKRVVILDVLVLASFYVMRVVAGAFAIDVPLSSWIILCTLFLSILLGAAKRKAELKLQERGATRAVLLEYNETLIDKLLTVAAGGAVLSYALYSVSPRTLELFRTDGLIYTTIFVVYGIFRYLYLLDKKSLGENPTQLLLTDGGTILNLLLWILSVIVIIYFRP